MSVVEEGGKDSAAGICAAVARLTWSEQQTVQVPDAACSAEAARPCPTKPAQSFEHSGDSSQYLKRRAPRCYRFHERRVLAAIAGYARWEGTMLTHQHQLTLSRVLPLPFPQHHDNFQLGPFHNVDRTAKSTGAILKRGEGARRAILVV
jgi:hypothetical protein